MMRGRLIRHKKIWIYPIAIDFRKQMNGLVQVVIEAMGARPNDAAIYVFQNRQKNKLKLLMWDRNGFLMGYKRLERGKFDFPRQEKSVEITWNQFIELFSGMPMVYLGKGVEKETEFA